MSNAAATKYYESGQRLRKDTPDITEKTINKYKGANGHLSADAIIEDLFEEIDANIFLSHSHKDLTNVLIFAGYLSELGYSPFVDSFVWNDAYKLLRKVNEIYSSDKHGSLIYEDVVHTSANIYMILNAALINMINRTDNYILLETDNTIQRGNTSSPWIYSELLYSRILCPSQLIFESTGIDFPAYTGHLRKLSLYNIESELGNLVYL